MSSRVSESVTTPVVTVAVNQERQKTKPYSMLYAIMRHASCLVLRVLRGLGPSHKMTSIQGAGPASCLKQQSSLRPTRTGSSYTMKGNNGQRAFQHKVRLFAQKAWLFLVFTLVLCFFVVFHSQYFSSSDDHRVLLVQHHQPPAVLVAREKTNDEIIQQELGHRDWSQDDLVGLDLIISASIHLIDIQVEESEQQVDEELFDNDHTYAGVYGTFCELDFSLQKQDPSAGTYSSSNPLACFRSSRLSYY
jgi:hypothetical protein